MREDQTLAAGTYRAKGLTWLDSFLLSPSSLPLVYAQVVHEETHTQHCRVSITCQWGEGKHVLRVHHPTRLRKREQCLPFDWDGEAHSLLRLLDSTHEPTHEHIDSLWDCWEQLCAQYVRSVWEPDDKARRVDLPTSGFMQQCAQRHRKQVHAYSYSLTLQALTRLKHSQAPLSPKEWSRQLDAHERVLQELGISSADFDLSKETPQQA